MSLLTLLQAVGPLCGIGAPAVVIGNADPTVVQLLGLATLEAEELSSKHEWSALNTTWTFTASGGPLFTKPLPTDWDRFPSGVELWNTGRVAKVIGPTPAGLWQEVTIRTVGTWPQRWRLSGGALQIWGAANADAFSTEYISTLWAAKADGTPQAAFLTDTDTLRVPERLAKLGIVWRWKKLKGLDYAEDMMTYERQLQRLAGADRGRRVIGVGGGAQPTPGPGEWYGTIGHTS